MPDRIADPWGPRSPYAPGDPWPERVNIHLAPGVELDQVQSWTRAASLLHSNGDAMDVASIGNRIVGVRGRSGDRVNRGRLGPKDLFGWQANASPDRLTRPLIRREGRLVETDWDTAMEAIVVALEGTPRRAGRLGADRLLHERPALPRGVLHARGDREGGHRDATHGRQHASLHGDRRGGAQGELRQRRPARQLCGRGPLRRHRAPRPQRRRDTGRAVDAHARSPARSRSARARGGRSPRHPPGARGRRPPGAAPRHQPRPPQRAHPRGPRTRLGGRGVRPVLDAGASRSSAVPPPHYPPDRVERICDVAARDVRKAARIIGTSERLLSTVLQGVYQSHQATAPRARSTTSTSCGACLGGRGAACSR